MGQTVTPVCFVYQTAFSDPNYNVSNIVREWVYLELNHLLTMEFFIAQPMALDKKLQQQSFAQVYIMYSNIYLQQNMGVESKLACYFHITTLLSAIRTEPDLSSCISKPTHMCCLYQYAEFISSGIGKIPGTLSDTKFEDKAMLILIWHPYAE